MLIELVAPLAREDRGLLNVRDLERPFTGGDVLYYVSS